MSADVQTNPYYIGGINLQLLLLQLIEILKIFYLYHWIKFMMDGGKKI